MIYQFKITLKDSKPPIWRRIEMKDTMTFHELHQVIQVSFDWWDSHLHGFAIRRLNGVAMDFYDAIGPMDDDKDYLDFDGYEHDEKEVQLKDIFKKEKDRVVYTYDYGDDWEHDIVLEKVLPEKSGVFYPRCTKAMREAPDEDSRFDYLETGIVTEDLEPDDFKNINDEFEAVFDGSGDVAPRFVDFFSSLDDEEEEEVEDEEDLDNVGDWHALLDAVDAFKESKPWTWLYDDQIFAIENPITGEYFYCSVMGRAGIEYGLVAYVGDEGLQYLKELLKQHNHDEKFYLGQRSLNLSLSNRDELDKEDYELLKDLGRSYRGKNQWPLFRSLRPGYHPWDFDPLEVDLFTMVLELVVEIGEMVKDEPELIPPWGVTEAILAFKYDEKLDGFMQGWLELKTEEKIGEVPLLVNELEIRELKKSLKRIDLPLEFGCEFVLIPVQEDHNERPYYPRIAIAVDRVNGLALYNDMLKVDNIVEACQESILKLVRQLDAIPREIWVKEELAPYIQPVADKLNIKIIGAKKLPFVADFMKEMEMMMPR